MIHTFFYHYRCSNCDYYIIIFKPNRKAIKCSLNPNLTYNFILILSNFLSILIRPLPHFRSAHRITATDSGLKASEDDLNHIFIESNDMLVI